MTRFVRRFLPRLSPSPPANGFTLVELMITLVVLGLVMVALGTVIYTASNSKRATSNNSESSASARAATDLIARDLRSAGYGIDRSYLGGPQPQIAYIDSLQVLINENLNPAYPDTGANPGIPLAYNPAGALKPKPLDGTAWAPPARYTTGAETVQWTLDVNNDGVVDANDIASANGVDAQRTPNPNDFELVRRVWGDSTGGVAGNNGGTMERVALITKPGGTVPPMFTVYLQGQSTPWDWANGPVPTSQLANIQKVVVNVTAPSAKADVKGNYASTRYTTTVSSWRNVPNFGAKLFNLTGLVFNDKDKNGYVSGTDVGIAGVSVIAGPYSVTTQSTGSFGMQVPQGTYTVRQSVPPGFGVETSPDSFVVTVPPGTSVTFADTARAGGWVTCFAFNDLNGNGVYEPSKGETPLTNATMVMTPGGQTLFTNSSGTCVLFAPQGGYTVTATPPDSFTVTSSNPVSATMSNGGSATINFAMQKVVPGTVSGIVFLDKNLNGINDSEAGIANVWVAVSPDGGATIKGYAYTDNKGNFSIQVDPNDPPHTTPYYLIVMPPPGFFPTSPTSVGPIWIQSNQTIAGYGFGMSSFQIISLNASRVLSLVSGDLVENDWGKNQSTAVHDQDIVLGADANGTDQVSVWFNQWNASKLFNSSPDYTRSAPNAVMSMALDLLDRDADNAPDLVTGTKVTASNNFDIWFNQRTNGNQGYFKSTPDLSYKTADNGDVQAVLTAAVAGGDSARDILVGTKSATANQGTVEIWTSSGSGNPTFSREEIYPPSGGLTSLGEVNAMILADIDGDGQKDLIIGTRTGTYSGEVVILRFLQGLTAPHFAVAKTINFNQDVVTGLAAVDVDGDGKLDLLVGTQTSLSSGKLYYYQNKTQSPSLFDFQLQTTRDAPGVVTCMAAADFGGSSRGDLAVGYRADMSSYAGGVRIYYLDSGDLPSSGTDPSGGQVVNMVAAMTVNNFNYGYPYPSPPFLNDLAIGVKASSTTGALVVFIR